MPVALAGIGSLTILPPELTIFLAQWYIQDSLFAPALVNWLDPGPQVGRTLIQASVLDEVPFALWCHLNGTVVPIKIIQV